MGGQFNLNQVDQRPSKAPNSERIHCVGRASKAVLNFQKCPTLPLVGNFWPGVSQLETDVQELHRVLALQGEDQLRALQAQHEK